jgi:hypothetical protein
MSMLIKEMVKQGAQHTEQSEQWTYFPNKPSFSPYEYQVTTFNECVKKIHA